MKKVIAIVLAIVVAIGLVACAANQNTEETTVSTEETTAAATTDATVAATLSEAFKAEAAKEGATTNAIATALSTNAVIAFGPMVQDMEKDSWLTGFDAETMTGYEACTAMMPMIGTIPFVSYVFELAADADKDAFVTTLKETANLRWNICTAAEEMLVETEGNFVFFVMAPLSFETEEAADDMGVEGDMAIEGDMGVEGDMAVEGDIAAYDPAAEEETVEETTVA